MTDKQIIIDGVDVNALYSDQIACMNRYEVARLFIKTVELLVAKEQECETLKLSEKSLTETIENIAKGFEELKAENERLEEQLELNTANAVVIDMAQRLYRYKQTLSEIKEIAEKHAPRCNDDAECDFECEACHLQDLKQILQKISECEVVDV